MKIRCQFIITRIDGEPGKEVAIELHRFTNERTCRNESPDEINLSIRQAGIMLEMQTARMTGLDDGPNMRVPVVMFESLMENQKR